MALRTCTRCGHPKDSEEFAWKNRAKGRRHSHCKSCQGKTSHQHYTANRDEYIDRAKKRYHDHKAENDVKFEVLLKAGKCDECGERDPKVLDFVHLPGKEKKDTVRRLLGQSWDIVEAEIAKCELLCANCRKKR